MSKKDSKTEQPCTLHSVTHWAFNLNMQILVKLDDKGYQRLADLHNEYVDIIPNWDRRTAEYYKKEADKEGYSEFQGWDFIQKFGDVTGIGFSTPYAATILIKKCDCQPCV